MDLIGSIVDSYRQGDTTEATALRTALGSNKMLGDRATDTMVYPYCVVWLVGSNQESAGKGYCYRIDSNSVQFDVFANDKAKVNDVLEALENLYCGSSQVKLTISGRSHLGSYFAFRTCSIDPDEPVFHGILQVNFWTEK